MSDLLEQQARGSQTGAEAHCQDERAWRELEMCVLKYFVCITSTRRAGSGSESTDEASNPVAARMAGKAP